MPDEAVGQHPPRLEPEAGPHEQGHRHAEEHQPDEQLGEAVPEPAGPHLLERGHRGQGDAPGDAPAGELQR